MLGPHQSGDAVIDVVVDQDRAQKLLFCLDIMGQGVGSRRRLPPEPMAAALQSHSSLPPALLIPPGAVIAKLAPQLATLIGLWIKPV